MKPMSLNLSRFRKVAEDKDTSTFQHHDAPHSITIAHKALPRDMRSYLKALPMYDADKADPEQSDEKFSSGGEVEKMTQEFKKKGMPKGNEKLASAFKKRANYDEGTPDKTVSAQDVSTQSDTPTPAASTPININIGGSGVATPSLTPTQATQVAPNNSAAAPPALPANTPESPAQGSATNGSAPPDASLDTAQAQLNSLQEGPQAQSPPPPSAQNLNPNVQDISYAGGLGQEYAGLAGAAQATGALGTEQAPIYDQLAKNLNANANNFRHGYNSMQNEALRLQDDVTNHLIDPNKYWDDHSKIATGLGIILAGFNPTNRPNAALEFLQNNIQRDTQQQMANLGARQDVLNHYYQMFGNRLAANEFVNASKQLSTANELQAAAARAQDPLQAARLNQLGGQLRQAGAKAIIPLAGMQAAFQGMRQGDDPSAMLPGLRMAAPDIAKQVEAHHWGAAEGSSDNEIPLDARTSVQKQKNILLKTQRLNDWIDANTIQGKLSPAHRGEGEALAGELAQFYSAGTGAGMSDQAQSAVHSFINQKPGGFLAAYLEDPKLRVLAQSMQDTINTIHKTYGYNAYKNNPNVVLPAQPQTAQQNTPSTQNADIQMKNGTAHQRIMINGKTVWRPIQ